MNELILPIRGILGIQDLSNEAYYEKFKISIGF